MSEKKTFADIVFGIKDKAVNISNSAANKVTDAGNLLSQKTESTRIKLSSGVKKAQDINNSNKKKMLKAVDASAEKLQKTSDSLLDKLIAFKNKILSKLGFDKYKKQYQKAQIGENNFVENNDETNNKKYQLFVGIVNTLKLDMKTDPNQIDILAKYVNGLIDEQHIKNTYNIANLADSVVKSKIDTDFLIDDSNVLNIEYNNKKNNVNMYLNGLQQTDCVKVGKMLPPEEKISGLDDVIEKCSIRLPGEPEPKSPMEILMEMMQQANPGANS